MRFSLIDKVVIITGASSGIGLACTKEFCHRGAKVVMAARNFDKLKELESALILNGMEAYAVKTDVTIESDCEHLINEAINKYGKIDIMINNAGISMRALFVNLKLDVIRKVMDVNFWGTVYCSKYALPHLLETKGALVGMSSVAGFQGLPGRSGYSASKFAMHGLLESIRVEHLKDGLHVMILAAGFTSSNIRKSALTADGTPQGESPRNEGKMMTPEKVAREMIKALKRHKGNRILSVIGQLMAVSQRIIPNIVDKEAYRRFAKEQDSPLNH
ncbi:MAG: SDR family oxidoreductase [Bacteroidales bacterium]|nr:SDR family oxidoreductase [Bacteroidales bacterium]